ncbi:MAG: DUF4157 domain-containing protein, partial [Methanothrix sp.]|nr:DUF4157 domain-containing protein [Methanothrix sp.]
MPDRLKAGIESLSGIDMSDVRVHAYSDRPARMNALAYTQGNQIHLGPGQEKHLPHEAWHAAQQKQGRVRATKQMMKGVAANDDAKLEKEADAMGQAASQRRIFPILYQGARQGSNSKSSHTGFNSPVTQLRVLPELMTQLNTTITVNKPDRVYSLVFNPTHNMYWIKKESRQGAEDSEKAYNAIESVLGVRRGRMMNPLWNLATPRVQIADVQDLAIITNLHIAGLVLPTADQRITISENAIGTSAEVPVDVDQYEVDHPAATLDEEDQRRSDFEDRFPIWKDKDYIKTLGYIAVVDLLIGNFDRINRNLNLKNWLVEGRSKTISLIDNIEIEGSLEDIDTWKANQFVNDFHNLGRQT